MHQVHEDAAAISAGRFPKATRDKLAKLKPESVLWALCKHFPWTTLYEANPDDLDRAAFQQKVREIHIAHESTRMKYLSYLLGVRYIDAATRRGDVILFGDSDEIQFHRTMFRQLRQVAPYAQHLVF